jgi:anti-sigma factor RsiW
MSCQEWQSRLDAYVDEELPPHEMEAFRAHAANCSDCASDALALMEAKSATRRAGQRFVASPALRARVMASACAQTSSSYSAADYTSAQPRKSTLLFWPRWALAAAALVVLVAGLFFAVNRYRQPSSLAEFADLHVADLASTNPVEVVSTDRHTVKPWFQGRIPFTFDVPDLQDSPFTLTGGRVTYFRQEPGAHLVFAYQRHFISAFIFRDTPQLAITGGSFTDHSTSFNLQTWTQDGLRYVLVSDVNPDTLKQLANLLQHPH